MNFDLSPEQRDFVAMLRDFVDEAIRPHVEEWDEDHELPLGPVKQMADLGLFGLPFPEEYGGAGGDFLTLCLAIEEIARVDSSLAITLEAAVGLGAMPIYRFGTEAQKQRWLPALAAGDALAGFGLTEPGGGSDAGATRTTAKLDGGDWVVNGSKSFITNAGTPITSLVTVTAVTAVDDDRKEISAIIIPSGRDGFDVGRPYRKMGWRHSDTRALAFDNCRVPEDHLLGRRGEGFRNFLQILDDGRIAIAALAVGLAQGCVDESVRYAREREAFGRPIGSFQSLAFKIADMATKTELARNAYFKAAWLKEEGRSYKKEAAMAKLYASEIAVDVARDAVQVHGGYGYIEEFPVCRHFRDSKILEIGEGTSEVMRMLIARRTGFAAILKSGRARPGSLVSSDEDLERTLEDVQSSGRMALDTEFLRERTYRSKLCLVQLATPEGLCLIDPLARVDLAPVAQLIADPGIEVVVHAGRQDLELFYERFGAVPANVFDVQIAAGFVGHGASLPYARVVEIVLGRRVPKGESYSDWCKRPLTDSQLRYAADDVAWLLEVADRLKHELSARERTLWAVEEMRVLERKSTYEVDPGESWRRVGGRGGLPASKLAVLREVARWREETALRRDLPRGWVLKDPTLIEIARRGPRDLAGLQAIRGMSAAEAKRSGRELLAAVAAGTRAGPMVEPEPLPRWAQVRARMISGLADALVRARSERAEVAAELVATRGELESLIADVVTGSLDGDGGRHRLLTGWRRDLAGGAVLDLARGRIGVRASDRPPYIEEVPL